MRTPPIQWLVAHVFVTIVVVAAVPPLCGQEVTRNDESATPGHRADETGDLPYPGQTLRDGIRNLAHFHEQAILADPTSIADYVGLVDAYTMLWCFGFAPRDEVLPKIKAAANQAIELDGQNAGARTALGMVKLSQWDWAGAEHELAEAVRLDPRRAASHHWYALYLASRGRHREAMRESEQAVALDTSVGMQTGRGAILYFGRDWTGLIDRMQSAIKQESTFAPAHDWLGMGYVQERRFTESIATYERAVDLSAGLAEILAGLGHAYGLAGEETKARAVLAKLRRLDARWYVPPVQIAYVLIGLKETDEAFQMLERAYREHSWELVFLQVEPWFDELRSDPRYVELIEKMKFPAIDRTPQK